MLKQGRCLRGGWRGGGCGSSGSIRRGEACGQDNTAGCVSDGNLMVLPPAADRWRRGPSQAARGPALPAPGERCGVGSVSVDK